MGARRIVLLAGPSGSGKSRVARLSGATLLRLDDYYLDADHAGLPRTGFGIADWDDPGTWDAEGALAALVSLATTGTAEVPTYDIALSRRVGSQTLTLPAPAAGERVVVVAEGIFAPHLLPRARAAGLSVTGIWLDRPRWATFAMRLARDLRERRKPPWVLLRRGLALLRDEPEAARRALALGCVPMTLTAAQATIERSRHAPCPVIPPSRH